jgi:two-component system chemotaxis response regulator CheB
MIRVLIVDDSPTLRHLIRAILESDPALRVVGEARHSDEAVALAHKLQPDIITMDIHMLQADGYQATRRIMAESPRPIVVLSDSKSNLEPANSLEALNAGALIVVGKPHGLPGADPQADQLIAQVKTMAEVKVVRRRWWLLGEKPASPRGEPVEPGQNRPVVTTPRAVSGPVRLIAIGASTGGPPALQIIFGQLPPGLPVPILVVQHISHGFVGGLARWLDDTTPLRIKVAENSESLRPGTVYLAPDDQHLLVAQGNLALLKTSPPVDGHRPSVTVLFESVARHYGSTAVGVLLTGMGSDGAQGLKALHDAGGHTIAQDEATSVVFGMPQQGIALGVAHEVLPLEQIGPRLAELVRRENEGTRR